MATAYVVKGYGKGYVAMNPWRYTQVSAEATSFSKIPAAVSFANVFVPATAAFPAVFTTVPPKLISITSQFLFMIILTNIIPNATTL